jgi:hypothetical protein
MSKLLEEAIADAKAVRATALANAKAALEEAFGKGVQKEFSKRLKEETMEEEDYHSDDLAGKTVGGSRTNPGSSRKADAAETEDNKGLDFGRPKFKEEGMDEGADEEAKMEEESSYFPGNFSKKGGHLASRAFKEEGADEGYKMEEESDDETMNNEELEAILKELSEDIMEEEGEAVPAAPAPAAPVAPAPEAPVAQVPAPPAPPAPVAEEEEAHMEDESDMEEVNLQELLNTLSESKDECMEEEEEEVCKSCGEAKCKCEEEEEKNELRKDLDEAIKAVKYLQTQLHEVNLLNAKLLYTNKLFKQANLTNEQKMKIVETFDLTQTIREVKIAYTSLAESFNFGKSTVKKSNSVAKTITEGLASKTVASTKPASSLIVENTNTQAYRFQTLAGIKKAK